MCTELQSPDAAVRLAACHALAEFGPKALAAAPRLESMIEDVDGDVCNAAAAALSCIERG